MNDPTILVVDDERHITHLVTYKLEQAGLRVMVAHNGLDAFDLAFVHRPDVIITDNQMPKMTGLELAEKLFGCEETSGIPLIMISGRGHKLKPDDLANTNIRHLIAKPFSPRTLVEVLGKLLVLDSGSKPKPATEPIERTETDEYQADAA